MVSSKKRFTFEFEVLRYFSLQIMGTWSTKCQSASWGRCSDFAFIFLWHGKDKDFLNTTWEHTSDKNSQSRRNIQKKNRQNQATVGKWRRFNKNSKLLAFGVHVR